MSRSKDLSSKRGSGADLLRRRRRISVAAGAVVAILVLLAGGYLLTSGKKEWSAKTTVVVLPSSNIGVGTAASYYDTLSHGQITSTVASILGLAQFKTSAANQLGIDPATAKQVTVQTAALTGTAIVTVTTTGPTRGVAAEMADEVVAQATPTVDSLAAPYQMSVVSQTNGAATQTSSLSTGKFLVVLAVVAVALGIGTQQAATQLVELSWRRRRAREAEADGDEALEDDLEEKPVTPTLRAADGGAEEGIRINGSASPLHRGPVGGDRLRSAGHVVVRQAAGSGGSGERS